MSLFSAPGSVLMKTTLLKSLQRCCSQHPDLLLIKTNTGNSTTLIEFPGAHTLLGKPMVIGASLSEPHTSESNGVIFIYIYILYICRTSFCKCKLTLLTRNIAHAAYKCGRIIEKNTWSRNERDRARRAARTLEQRSKEAKGERSC